MAAEFCPKCKSPVDTGGDERRLCEVCGWFGDRGETITTRPALEEFNPVLTVIQSLRLFRDVCRNELIAEQVYQAGRATDADLRKVATAARESLHSLVELFTAVRKPHKAPPPTAPLGSAPTVLRSVNGLIPWPEDWTDYHFNGNEPCDMLIGPCACGAWHQVNEAWVQELLTKHNTVIG